MGLPQFLVKRIPKQENIRKIRRRIEDPSLHTVCESAKCPNIGECFSKNSLTFMILGNVCTRNCRFCGVETGIPLPVDSEEPTKISAASQKLALKYVVITSVTRDDLPDGGAAHFATTVRALSPRKVEVLIPDFRGREESLKTVLDSSPYVLNHNIETVPRLYPSIRPQADYRRSLLLLEKAKMLKDDIYTKSGFMVGLGERKEEVFSVLYDLKKAGVDIVTIGQYLPPSRLHPKIERYVEPGEFEAYKEYGKSLNFLQIFAGPFVRSSYHAAKLMEQ